MSFLKNHPFAVEAFFESSLVLTFAVPKEQLQYMIPGCLELDTFNDKWAFIAIAMVQTKGLRPKGFPAFMGNDFFLIGYRVFVRFRNEEGRNLRGLYILKSETNKKKMEVLGNIFTHYDYSTTDISQSWHDDLLQISSLKSGFDLKVRIPGGDHVPLPVGSPFSDWKETRRFAGPLPFTFTYDSSSGKVLVIEGVRKDWKPMPVQVVDHQFSFIKQLGIDNIQLANAFIIRNIPYYWKKGKIEQWSKIDDNSRVS
ncbi:hypothetical protein OI18_17445 [Flavihumibacter solisilvae]|uniref:DUF2071 domain-containing protein n=1 Tax=Flavihumibacter solisilvae TaxID=1349421 RepID=A0A0C1IT58_9BACT|nr:hypothetical protein OI18_17445 [Flavihumibacter solisilvae]